MSRACHKIEAGSYVPRGGIPNSQPNSHIKVMTTTLAHTTRQLEIQTEAQHLEHTTAAVHELAIIYKFEASEALQRLGLSSTVEEQEDALRSALQATVHRSPGGI